MGRPKKRNRLLIPLILLVLAGGAAAYIYLEPQKKSGGAAVENYRTEVVQRGNVSAGVRESGSVTFGSNEQEFSVAQVTVTSVSGDEEEDENSGSGSADDTGTAGQSSSQSGQNTGQSGQSGSQSGQNTGQSGQNSSQGGQTQNASGSDLMKSGGTAVSGDSSGEETSLIVEEVYAAAGKVLAKGDPVLKITEDSISEYREELENAVSSASLAVSQEEINAESKKAEAEYTYEINLAKGETAQETYEATLESLEKAVTDLEEEISEAEEDGEDEEDIEELRAQLVIAKNNQKTKAVEAKQTLDNALTSYKYADQLYEIDTEGLDDDLEDAKDTLAEAEQNLADFEEQIGDGIIYSEYAGTVTEVAYAAGDAMMNDAVCITLTDPSEVSMTVSVSQEDISSVAVGDFAVMTLTAYPGEEFAGEVGSIASSSSAGSSTVNYDVVVYFTGDTGKIYSGMTGEALLGGKTVGDTLYISNRAVQMDGARSYVRVLDDDGTVREVDIKTGFSNGSIVAVEEGLSEGMKVIIESGVSQ